MKDYMKVKEILIIQATPTSKHNKLVKIGLTTKDSKLKELLEDLSKAYKLSLTRGWSRSRGSVSNVDAYSVRGVFVDSVATWRSILNVVKEDVSTYVDSKLAEEKPAWQVEAEKHGWTPPQ